MRNPRSLVLGALLVTTCSCCSLYSVSPWEKGAPSGVPFFTKKGVIVHTTTYDVSWLAVSLKADAQERGFLVSENAPLAAALEKAKGAGSPSDVFKVFEEELKKAKSLLDEKDIRVRVSDLEKEKDGAPTGFYKEQLLVSLLENSEKVVAEPDYEHPLAYNVLAFPFSATSGEIDLAPDGTLAKGTASLDTSKLAEALAGVAQERIKARAPAAPVAPAGDEKAAVKELELTVVQSGYAYTFTERREVPRAAGCEKPSTAVLEPIPFNLQKRAYKRSTLGQKPAADDGDAIHFQGSVELPKPKE